MAVTTLGKFLRKLRIDQDERLYDMARRLDVSSAFLSGVENGHKKASNDLVDKIVSTYNLTLQQQEELQYARSESAKQIDLSQFSPEKREATLMFARKFDDLTQAQVEQIKDILKGDD